MATISLRAVLLRDHARLLRMALWIIAMAVTEGIVGWYWPHKAVFVPCTFLAIMVPAVLLPMQARPKPDAR